MDKRTRRHMSLYAAKILEKEYRAKLKNNNYEVRPYHVSVGRSNDRFVICGSFSLAVSGEQLERLKGVLIAFDKLKSEKPGYVEFGITHISIQNGIIRFPNEDDNNDKDKGRLVILPRIQE